MLSLPSDVLSHFTEAALAVMINLVLVMAFARRSRRAMRRFIYTCLAATKWAALAGMRGFVGVALRTHSAMKPKSPAGLRGDPRKLVDDLTKRPKPLKSGSMVEARYSLQDDGFKALWKDWVREDNNRKLKAQLAQAVQPLLETTPDFPGAANIRLEAIKATIISEFVTLARNDKQTPQEVTLTLMIIMMTFDVIDELTNQLLAQRRSPDV